MKTLLLNQNTVLKRFVFKSKMYDRKISQLSNKHINNFWRNKIYVFNLDLCGHKTGVFNRSKIM